MGRVTKAIGHFSEDEIRERIRVAKTPWISQKWLVILHATVDPKPAREIALHVGVGKGTVHNLISHYNRFGPSVVEGVGRGGRRNSHLTREEEAEFIAPFIDLARKGQIVVGAQIGKVLEERVGRPLHHSIIYRLLDRNGWRKVVPRPFHVESRKEAQEDFKKKLPEKIEQILADRDPADKRPVAYVPQDEGRFGRISELLSCWAPKGIRPEVAQQIIREYLYVYAAVCPALAKMTALILPWANTEMMNIFLEEVSRDFSEFFVIMQVDQASWHNSKNLKIPENIRLLPQPSHSPELNPVEHVWDELREKALPNLAFKSLEEVEQALCSEIVRLQNDPERLRSLTNFPYLRIPC